MISPWGVASGLDDDLPAAAARYAPVAAFYVASLVGRTRHCGDVGGRLFPLLSLLFSIFRATRWCWLPIRPDRFTGVLDRLCRAPAASHCLFAVPLACQMESCPRKFAMRLIALIVLAIGMAYLAGNAAFVVLIAIARSHDSGDSVSG